MEALQEIPGYVEKSGEKGLPVDIIRREAMKEAALSYGARGGLAARSYKYVRNYVRASYLDKVFNFSSAFDCGASGLYDRTPDYFWIP